VVIAEVEAEMTVMMKMTIEFSERASSATKVIRDAKILFLLDFTYYSKIFSIYSLAVTSSSSFVNSSASIFCSCCHETLNTFFSFVVKLNM
jgi:hypothetical protein